MQIPSNDLDDALLSKAAFEEREKTQRNNKKTTPPVVYYKVVSRVYTKRASSLSLSAPIRRTHGDKKRTMIL